MLLGLGAAFFYLCLWIQSASCFVYEGTRSGTRCGNMHCHPRASDWLSGERNNELEALYLPCPGWGRQDAWHGIWTTDTQDHWADSGKFM